MQTIYYDLRDTKGQQKEIEDKISAAAKILREGGLVGIPTETVYGLAANGLDEKAVKRIFEAKGRPQDNPLILTIPGQQWLPRYCKDIPPLAYVLARKFWPGPLTMILKCRTDVVPSVITAGLDTVAMRCPNHPVTLAIIREAGIPVAAPSANTSGRPSCTTAQDVLEDMDGKIEGVVDGGPCTVGVESTILDLTCDPPRLLRPGGLPLEALEQLIGPIAVDKAVVSPLQAGEQPKAPGMKYRHYAPDAEVVVAEGSEREIAAKICREYDIRESMWQTPLIFATEQTQPFYRNRRCVIIGDRSEPATLCASLFYSLREYGSRADVILAEALPNDDMGLAYMNRLLRSAGFNII